MRIELFIFDISAHDCGLVFLAGKHRFSYLINRHWFVWL